MPSRRALLRGAVALAAALADPARVASVILFEPVLFSVLMAEDATQAAAREIAAVRDDTVRRPRTRGPARVRGSICRLLDGGWHVGGHAGAEARGARHRDEDGEG